MKICDLCGEPTIDLRELRDFYQSDGIKELCEACENWANREKDDIAKRCANDLRQSLITRKAAPPTPRKRWWAFFSKASANSA